MSDDLIERLRGANSWNQSEITMEAANEIERLREELAALKRDRYVAVSAVRRLSAGQPFDAVLIAEGIKQGVETALKAQNERLKKTSAQRLIGLCKCGLERDALEAQIAQSEQEPVAAQHRFRHPQKTMPNWSPWQPCAISSRPSWEIDSIGYEVEYRALYTTPQPSAEVESLLPEIRRALSSAEQYGAGNWQHLIAAIDAAMGEK
jgi:hypothetical protein